MFHDEQCAAHNVRVVWGDGGGRGGRMLPLRRRHDALVAEHALLSKRRDKNTADIASLESRSFVTDAAKLLFQEAGELAMADFRDKVMSVCSVALKDVFGDKYTVKIVVSSRGEVNVTQEAYVLVVDEEGHEMEPMGDNGGGLGDIASWAVRLACLALRKPTCRKVLIMDEPFRDLSGDLRALGGEMLRKVAKALGLQIIMTSNEKEYAEQADKVINVEELVRCAVPSH
jgi:DNA repair exonuclease SbcCD ATPase subunit